MPDATVRFVVRVRRPHFALVALVWLFGPESRVSRWALRRWLKVTVVG